ncbi:hypothetical protein JQ582_40825 [Bradyrhizobium japonicum]|uniref:hypothetical protein n=1 Tax=Bradyrhizobium japonicum TaxID=375 RepID=UPI001BA80036|nr:hypothetical protein [Bradyrhizobium japonicum]MBR0750264.1 hypothetical protein [Bradyrhizobium japonicum]
MNSTEGSEFVHFDEYEDVVAAIELVGSQSIDAQKRPSHWKWIIMAMQNAVQGAMVLSLSGTDGCGALAPKSQQRNRAWLNHLGPDRPPRVMASYDVLLERIMKSELMEGPVPDLSAEDHRNLQRLNELRRQFAHFNPTNWGIELNYILDIIPVALNLFEFLTTTQGRPTLHFSEEHRTRMQRALSQARAAVEAFNEEAGAAVVGRRL